MTQDERLDYLIDTLISEQPSYRNLPRPTDAGEKKRLLRSLLNVRQAAPVSDAFLRVQDEYLQEALKQKGVTRLGDLSPVRDDLYLWRGDITTLAVDGIVNAANSGMTGCYCPCHGCIDNAIHTFAGVQLRLACAEMMQEQGAAEPTGTAKITSAYNLPCRYVLHTVGPIVTGSLTPLHERQLASCYRACLELAEQNGLLSIAFCCISTGEFHFPGERAAEIAIDTVADFLLTKANKLKVVFNVFKETDYDIYKKLLGTDC